MANYAHVLGDRERVRVTCPRCSPTRRPHNRTQRCLTIWLSESGHVGWRCWHCNDMPDHARSAPAERAFMAPFRRHEYA